MQGFKALFYVGLAAAGASCSVVDSHNLDIRSRLSSAQSEEIIALSDFIQSGNCPRTLFIGIRPVEGGATRYTFSINKLIDTNTLQFKTTPVTGSTTHVTSVSFTAQMLPEYGNCSLDRWFSMSTSSGNTLVRRFTVRNGSMTLLLKNDKEPFPVNGFSKFNGQAIVDGPARAVPVPEIPQEVPNPAVEIKTNGHEYCARYNDNTLKCWTYRSTDEGDGSGILKRPPYLGAVKSFDLAENTACAVTDGGAVDCWGSNNRGILSVPQQLTQPRAARKVVVGRIVACAITEKNTVHCWGDKFSWPGEPSGAAEVPADLGPVNEVKAFDNMMCAITKNETLKCWGRGADYYMQSAPPDLRAIKDFFLSYQGSCAVLTDGKVRCWENLDNPDGLIAKPPTSVLHDANQIILNHEFPGGDFRYSTACVARNSAVPACWGDNQRNQSAMPLDLKPVTQIAMGRETMCGIEKSGEVRCWEYGGASLATSATHKANYLNAKGASVCSIDLSGNTTCWGRNHYTVGAFGRFSAMFDMSPNNNTSSRSISEQTIALGRDHSCVLYNGHPNCQGSNSAGQGVAFSPFDDWANERLTAGFSHNCSLRSDGTVKCWGDNSKAQLLVPKDLLTASAFSAGRDHTCAISKDGRVHCWGDIEDGKTNVPSDVDSALAIAAGEKHSCALLKDGKIKCWGDNSQSQINVPSFNQRAKAVTAGSFHSCAILQDDSLRCWGANRKGESTPPRELGAVNQIAAGEAFTCAIRTRDSSVHCWGDNTYGQLEVPSQTKVGQWMGDALGDRIFYYGERRNLLMQWASDSGNSFYHVNQQTVFAYQGLKSSWQPDLDSHQDIAYDLTVTYNLSCKSFETASQLGFNVFNSNYSAENRIFRPALEGERQTLEIRNLTGPTRIALDLQLSYGGYIMSSDSNCYFTIENVMIEPGQNIPRVLIRDANILANQLKKNHSSWLLARTEFDIEKDGVAASKANLNAKKNRLVGWTQHILVSNGIDPGSFGLDMMEWSEAEVENALFTELTAVDLRHDKEARLTSESVRMARPRVQWPPWAQGLVQVYLKDLGTTADEFIAQALIEYQGLLEHLKLLEHQPRAVVTKMEKQLKDTILHAREFISRTSEIRSTVEREINLLQQSLDKGSDVCKNQTDSASFHQCL